MRNCENNASGEENLQSVALLRAFRPKHLTCDTLLGQNFHFVLPLIFRVFDFYRQSKGAKTLDIYIFACQVERIIERKNEKTNTELGKIPQNL